MHGAIQLGRPRKHLAARERNGQVRRDKPKDHPPTLVKRLRDEALKSVKLQEWATELGRMFLTNQISAAQYDAGKKWAENHAIYLKTIGVHEIRVVPFQRGIAGHDPDPDSAGGQEVARKDRAAIDKFNAAHRVLMGAGQGPEAAVRRVCDLNLAVEGYQQFLWLEIGLDRLDAHYGLTRKNK